MQKSSFSFRGRTRSKSKSSIDSIGPEGLPSRKSSIFVDLLTLLRKNSILTSSAFAALPGAYYTCIENPKDEQEARETDAFLQTEGEEDENKPMSRQKILEKIRQKKEIIGKLRCQPWSMRRKRRTLRLAQKYLERHEAKVSKTHLYKEEIARQWKKFRRWLDNISIYLIPWEAKIKTIESHFGSVVSSYFVFLRWIFWVNFIITLIVSVFVVMPEVLSDVASNEKRFNRTYDRKHFISEREAKTADHIQTVWDFEGYLRISPLFYGYYSDEEYVGKTIKYRIPLAYFLVILFVLGYSFFAILRKMAANARTSKLAGGKGEQYTFNWKIFTGWDYTIGNPETASNTVMANVNKLRESIAEYRVKMRQKFVCVRFLLRILANLIIIGMVALSTWLIQYVVARSVTIERDMNAGGLQKNEVPIVVSLITLIFPSLFELVGMMERYHPRTSLRLQLGRVYVLYILNYYTLIFALFNKMEGYSEIQRLNALKENRSSLSIGVDSPTENDARSRRELELFWLSKTLDTPPPHSNLTNSSQILNKSSTFDFDYFDLFDPNNTIPPLIKILLGEQRNSSQTHSRTTRQLYIDAQGKNGTSKYYEYSTQPPLQFTTIHPDYGSVGVDKAKAFIKQTGQTQGPTDPGSTPWLPVKVGEYAWLGTPDEIKNLCWETMVGQEICKLVTTDLVMTIASILLVDFFRGLWVRYCNEWWCWDLEKTFPEYGEFKVAENVLHIINNQGMIWLGIFFSPLIPAINNIKLIILMYIRAWACSTCNVPSTQIFRASRSSNFYLMMLLLMLFLCTLPVGYVIASREPSKNCGPFTQLSLAPDDPRRFYNIITNVFKKNMRDDHLQKLEYIASPGVIVPLLLLLMLIIYFLVSLVRGLREANDDLQKQLLHERTEEKKKIFHMAGVAHKKKSGGHLLASGMPDTKKIDLSHLPIKEKQRRDPWHKRARDYASTPEVTTDEDESGGSTPRKPSPMAPPLPELGAKLLLMPPVEQYRPGLLNRSSLGSLKEEGDTSISEADEKPKRKRTVDFVDMEVSASSTATGSTIEEVKLDEETSGTPSPQEPVETPEEIREFLASQNDNRKPYGAEGFPSPTNEIFMEPDPEEITTPRSEPSSYDNQTPRSPLSDPTSPRDELRKEHQLNHRPVMSDRLDELHTVLVHPYKPNAYEPLIPSTDDTDTTETVLSPNDDSSSDLDRFAKDRLTNQFHPLTPATVILSNDKSKSEDEEEEDELFYDTDEPLIKPVQSKPILTKRKPGTSKDKEPSKTPFSLGSAPLITGFAPWPTTEPAEPEAPPRRSRGRKPGRLNLEDYDRSPSAGDPMEKFIEDEMPSTSTSNRPKFKIAVSPSPTRTPSEDEGSLPRKKFVIRQTPVDRSPSSGGIPATISVVDETQDGINAPHFRTMSKFETDV